MGLRVLQGEERQHLQRMIAIERAEFEAEYAGRKVEPFGHEQIAKAAMRRAGTDIYVSDAFVRGTRGRLEWAKKIVAQFGDAETS